MKYFSLKSKLNLNLDDERSRRQLKNISLSFVYKSIAIGCSFLMVPLTLHYLDIGSYGIWLTISSIVGWIGFFDGGLGNGLKNKLSESIAKDDLEKAQAYITSAYVGIIGIVIAIVILFLTVSSFLNWTAILKSPPLMAQEVKITIYVVFILFGIRLIVDLITVLLSSHQLVGMVSFLNLLINIILLGGVFVITRTVHTHKLIFLGGFISLVPIVVLILASIYFFSVKYSHLTPRFSTFDMGILKDIMSLGITFFIIQIAALIIFSSDNLIITQIFGPSEVTVYNICYKYFGILTFGWSMIITPYWIAFNEAYTKKEYDWIRKTILFLLKVWLVLVVGVIFFLAVSKDVFALWIGKGIQIPLTLSVFMAVFILLSTNINICAYFLNGIGKIRLQFYASIFSGLINIPLTILCAKTLGMGVAGVILGTSLSLISGGILLWIQTYKIINQKDTGIWSK